MYIFHIYIYYLCHNIFYTYANGFLKIRWKQTDKCHLLISKSKFSQIHKGESTIKSSDYEKLLGIKIDSKLQQFWWSCVEL